MIGNWRHPGIMVALGAALLFGAGTPLAKILLDTTSPWLLAGILYLGAGIGLAALRCYTRAAPEQLTSRDIGWFAGAVVSGGIIGPVLLMWGLSGTHASTASLLLNAEGVLTALIAWFIFRENFDRRIALGIVCIVAGAIVLAWPQDGFMEQGARSVLPALAIIGACLAWAIDNNLTRKVSLTDASYIAMVKGLAAGLTNVAIALAAGATTPPVWVAVAGAVLGFLSYGISLVLFVIALRHLGTARTGAYFSVAPFVGALIAVPLLGEPITVALGVAACLMGIGLWLHVSEHHAHEHTHEAMEHDHEHVHDAHHGHVHEEPLEPGASPRHSHRHDPVTHSHAHYPTHTAHHTHTHPH